VWYFFHGILADPDVLSRLLSLTEEPELRLTSVMGGVVRRWAGKYKELVDMLATTSASVDG